MIAEGIYSSIARDISYDPVSGTFTWEVNRGTARVGDSAGSVGKRGYLYISWNRTRVLAHRLAWFIHTKEVPETVDHINRVPLDNRLVNLRGCSHAHNCRNRGIRSTNSTGVQGVTRVKNRWQAYLHLNGKKKHLGCFLSLDEATEARQKAEEKYFGEFAPKYQRTSPSH